MPEVAGRDKESQAVRTAAMRYVKYGTREELEAFSPAALRKADYQLGALDMGWGYRKAITDRIAELESDDDEIQIQESDVVDIKPNFFGIGLNLNELWRRIIKGWKP